jgi:hypothetical protein
MLGDNTCTQTSLAGIDIRVRRFRTSTISPIQSPSFECPCRTRVLCSRRDTSVRLMLGSSPRSFSCGRVPALLPPGMTNGFDSLPADPSTVRCVAGAARSVEMPENLTFGATCAGFKGFDPLPAGLSTVRCVGGAARSVEIPENVAGGATCVGFPLCNFCVAFFFSAFCAVLAFWAAFAASLTTFSAFNVWTTPPG